MLHLEFRGDAVLLRMEGPFAAALAENARRMLARCPTPAKLVIDVSQVTFVDAVGEEVLSWFGRIGAEFVAASAYSFELCRRLHLQVQSKWHKLSSIRQLRAVADHS